MQQNKPAAPAVLETLDRLLASETFARSERARKLLRYLVEREQAGEAGQLKGFAIAIDVFGKDADFDPSTDAVVRVQAGRLRDLLAQYSAAEGAGDPLRIVIPRGSYVPAYEMSGKQPGVGGQPAEARTALPAAEALEAAQFANFAFPAEHAGPILPSGAQMIRQLQFFWAAVVVIIVMLGILVFRIAEPVSAPVDQVSPSTDAAPGATSSTAAPTPVEVLPPVYIALKSTAAAPAQVASVLRMGVAGFDTVDFIAKALDPADPPDPMRFVFQVSSAPKDGATTIELQHVATGKVLVSRTLTAQDTDPSKLDDTIADLLSSTVPASGAIYGYLEQIGSQTGLTECLLLNDNYYLDQSPQRHEAAYRCFEALATANAKSPLVYAELAALHMEAISNGYAYPDKASAEQALGLGHRAIQMGATSPYAHRAYGFLNSRIGNSDEGVRWMRKAYELNTYDLSMAAAYGYALIFAGDFSNGAAIMERAVEASSAHPSWWDYYLFLAEFMLGETNKAARATEALVTVKRAHYLAARAIVANTAQNAELTSKLVGEIVADHPKFAADPRAFFVKGKYPPALIERMLDALRTAGLGGPS